jgi:hypothetical protein
VPATPAAEASRGKHARDDVPLEHYQSEPDSDTGTESGSEAELEGGSEPATRSAHASPALSPDAMLMLLAAESSKPLPGLLGRLESKGSRVALMAGGMALISLLLIGVMAVLGALI